VKVWRVQHPILGNGPYNPAGREKGAELDAAYLGRLRNAATDLRDAHSYDGYHQAPQGSGYYAQNYEVFGFASSDLLRRWLPRPLRVTLRDLGYIVVVSEVYQYAYDDGRQVAFWERYALETARYSLLALP